MGHPELTDQAMRFLQDLGYAEYNESSVRISAQGFAYWERLQAPRWHWFKRNITTIIAVSALFMSIAAIVVSALD